MSDLQPTEPFYLTRSFATTEDAVNAVVMMHETGGVQQVSLSAVARHLRMARSSVHHAHRGLAGFYAILTELFGYRWREWIADGDDDALPVRLPDDGMSRLGVLTWSSLRAIAGAEARAGRPEAWKWVEAVRRHELRFLREQIRAAAPDAEADAEVTAELVEGLLALADGLRDRMTDPLNPLERSDATTILAAYWTRVLGLPLPPPPPG